MVDSRAALGASWTATASSTDFITGAATGDDLTARTIPNEEVFYTPGGLVDSMGVIVGTVLTGAVATPGAGGAMGVSQTAYSVSATVGNNEPASDFEISTLTAARTDDGLPVVQADVENTGGRAIDMSGQLTLSDGPGSLSAGPFPAELGTTLAPGDTAPVSIVLDRSLPDGPWHATLTLRSGLLEKKVEADITFPEPGETATPVPVEAWWQQWPVLAGFAIAVLLGLCAVPVARRRRREETETDEQPVPVG